MIAVQKFDLEVDELIKGRLAGGFFFRSYGLCKGTRRPQEVIAGCLHLYIWKSTSTFVEILHQLRGYNWIFSKLEGYDSLHILISQIFCVTRERYYVVVHCQRYGCWHELQRSPPFLHLSSQHNTTNYELDGPQAEPRATFVPTRDQNLQGYYFLSMLRATPILQVHFQDVLVSPLQPSQEPSDK